MRPQTQPDHIEFSNSKPLDFDNSRPRLLRQFLDHDHLQSEFGHTGRMVWIELGCTCNKRNNTYSTCEWQRLRSACAFDKSLSSQNNVFCDLFCLPKTVICGKFDQTRLVSLRIITVSMVHLYSKSLALPERCMCEKEVIITACAPPTGRCGGAPEAQELNAGLLT